MHPTPKLCFFNPGLLDPRLITTFGATVKPGANPFGRFGTGLKYAIAGVLRLGGQVTIYSGSDSWKFFSLEEEIRGKTFHTIHMEPLGHDQLGAPVPCGFTTELGSHWEPWMLYRELLCNARDESGTVSVVGSASCSPDTTSILIDCPPLLAVHSQRHEHFLPAELQPLWSDSTLAIYAHPSTHAYFRGIRVYTLPKPALYTYNLLGDVTLTEDRTLADSWFLRYTLANTALRSAPEPWLSAVLTARDGTFEHDIDWTTSWHSPSQEFLTRVRDLSRSRLLHLSRTALDVLHKHNPTEALPPCRDPSPIESHVLATASALCLRLGVPITSPIRIVSSLGPDVLGAAIEGQIWITSQCFLEGPQRLAGTLLEEQIHLTHGFGDCSRGMQNFLIELAMNAAAQLDSERQARATPINDEIPF